MSHVTNVMFIAAYPPDQDRLDNIHAWLADNGHPVHFKTVQHSAGGFKAIESQVFMCAFNHLDVDLFVEYMKSLRWHEPDWVQLFVKDQDDDIWTERLHEVEP